MAFLGGQIFRGQRVMGAALIVGLAIANAGCATASVAPDGDASTWKSAIAPCDVPGTRRSGVVLNGLPSIELPCMGASGPPTVRLSDLSGKPLIISVWTSYCLPCRDELKALAGFMDINGSRVKALTVLVNDDAESSALILEIARNLPVAYDRDAKLLKELGQRVLTPTTILVRGDGTIALTYQGPPLASVEEIDTLVASTSLVV